MYSGKIYKGHNDCINKLIGIAAPFFQLFFLTNLIHAGITLCFGGGVLLSTIFVHMLPEVEIQDSFNEREIIWSFVNLAVQLPRCAAPWRGRQIWAPCLEILTILYLSFSFL